MTRTEVSVARYSEHNHKWCIGFITRKGPKGDDYVCGEITSACVFDSSEEAYEGGLRAIAYLEKTGAFPNMCEKF
jgi:hypothetical protein